MENSLSPADTIILCVEDEVDLREILVEEMRDAGYQVIEASDGKEALVVLQQTRPSLILCDIAMPRMDGYQLLQHIRVQHSELADVPFIFLSAQDQIGQIVSGKHAGADDYLVKPVNFDLMLATIDARLRQVQRLRSQLQTQVVPITNAAAGPDDGVSKVFQRISKTLDFINSGIVLLDANAQTLLMNNTAKTVINKALCPDITAMVKLSNEQTIWQHAAIRQAIIASKNGDDYIDFLSLACHTGQRDVLLTICALKAESTYSDEPVVALFFSHSGNNALVPFKALEALFQLTPMESRVAWAFAQGMRSEEIAQTFSISMTTVAFHKRNIFQKTQTNRQADLVALLLTLPTTPSVMQH
ncbi:MAG: response regulator [Pseudomonas sp.]|jgi:DNA-binding response OmpR family regulator/DNA-binding CsgD family transcriptional regulator|uniref:response regulator n=1 Tax=Denitrificimonas caeni TaxID=521720 RepID=UPI001963DFE9|nr:response regulator [Denitrificimonas caeni]MCK9533108.1 response regulator [Pseudomonas sp.]MDY0415449.1 response regulator [Pseudomonas sp.]